MVLLGNRRLVRLERVERSRRRGRDLRPATRPLHLGADARAEAFTRIVLNVASVNDDDHTTTRWPPTGCAGNSDDHDRSSSTERLVRPPSLQVLSPRLRRVSPGLGDLLRCSGLRCCSSCVPALATPWRTGPSTAKRPGGRGWPGLLPCPGQHRPSIHRRAQRSRSGGSSVDVTALFVESARRALRHLAVPASA